MFGVGIVGLFGWICPLFLIMLFLLLINARMQGVLGIVFDRHIAGTSIRTRVRERADVEWK
jgi:hypothetical protein